MSKRKVHFSIDEAGHAACGNGGWKNCEVYATSEAKEVTCPRCRRTKAFREAVEEQRAKECNLGAILRVALRRMDAQEKEKRG